MDDKSINMTTSRSTSRDDLPASTPDVLQAAKKFQGEEENPELIRFREEWLAELGRRKGESNSSVSSSAATSAGSHLLDERSLNAARHIAGTRPSARVASTSNGAEHVPLRTSHPAVENGGITTQFHASKPLENALNIYCQAIEHEQRGDLDQALLLYRQAFRMHDNVDRAYQRNQMLKNILKDQQVSASNEVGASAQLKDAIEDLSASFESAVTIKPRSTRNETTILMGPLATLISGYTTDLRFEPENEAEPVLLNTLPEEMVVMIIGKLDPTSLERFATVSKKARLLTLDPGIWRKLVQRTYFPPQIPGIDTLLPVIEKFKSDYRRVFIEHPRVRLDGVYIATCHYVRPGLSENHWVNVSHLITYHRYLRFFPNGQVLSLLANEEHAPQQVIPLLKSTLRMKGLFLGQWQLLGTTVHISNLVDASARSTLLGLDDLPPELPPTAPSSTGASGARTRYVFAMTLDLRSRPLGRWNRMDIQSYDSVNIENGDVYPVALKHERPFWFSKVRSYI